MGVIHTACEIVTCVLNSVGTPDRSTDKKVTKNAADNICPVLLEFIEDSLRVTKAQVSVLKDMCDQKSVRIEKLKQQIRNLGETPNE